MADSRRWQMAGDGRWQTMADGGRRWQMADDGRWQTADDAIVMCIPVHGSTQVSLRDSTPLLEERIVKMKKR